MLPCFCLKLQHTTEGFISMSHTAQSTIGAGLDVLTPAQTARAIRRAISVRRALFIWGAPGIAKSSVVYQVADSLYGRDSQGEPLPRAAFFIDLRGSLIDPVDLRGLPVADIERRLTRWLTPEFLPTSGRGILFLDELNRAPIMVQNALLQLALDRRIGDYVLPDGWYVVAAGNRVSDGGAGVQRLDLALAKRFIPVVMAPDLSEFLTWGNENGIHPIVLAFLKFRQSNGAFIDAFFAPDPKNPSSPDPRAWEFVSDLLWSHEADPEDDSVLLAMVSGIIGRGVGIEFMAYLARYAEMVSIGDPLADPTGARVPTDPATLYAVASSVAARATWESMAAAVTYLRRLPGEYRSYALRDATLRDSSLADHAAYTETMLADQLSHR